MNRGLNRCRIFSSDEDFALFIKTFSESCKFFNVYVSAYCLMGIHYHLVINTPDANISRFMRHLNGVYTQRRELSGLSFFEIANEYGVASYKTPASASFRLRNRIESDKKIKARIFRTKNYLQSKGDLTPLFGCR